MLIGDRNRSDRNLYLVYLYSTVVGKIFSYISDQNLGVRLKGKDMVSHTVYRHSTRRCLIVTIHTQMFVCKLYTKCDFI
jgi:hypothetical protein